MTDSPQRPAAGPTISPVTIQSAITPSAATQTTRPNNSPGQSIDRPLKRRRNVRFGADQSESDPNEIIDVDLFVSMWEPGSYRKVIKEETHLDVETTVSRTKYIEMSAFDADGIEHRFVPEYHFFEQGNRMKDFFSHIARSYHDGKPMHIAAPELSTLDIIPYTEFQALSPSQIQDRLRFKNVVVTGCPHPNMNFDEDGLQTLCPLDSQVSIQDYSISSDCPSILVGHTRDILTNARSNGKILNGLDFPMWKDPQWSRSSYATDMVAWEKVRGWRCCGDPITHYPTEHMRWGLAGTAHAFTTLHLDSDGFSTFVQVMCGKKIWILYRPHPDVPVTDTNLFINDGHFQFDSIPEHAAFDLEELLMQPGIPHAVYGVENTIIHGGHFYCASQMQATVESLVHTFVLSEFISNTNHYPSRELLRRIAIFWAIEIFSQPFRTRDSEEAHLPNVRTFRGLMDLISGCTLSILGNVLDFRTYSAPNQLEWESTTRKQTKLWKEFDRNDIPGDERLAICYARGVALVVFAWIRDWCIVQTPDGKVIEDLPSKYVVNLLIALARYKDNAEAHGLNGAPHCKSWMLTAQISNVVKCDRSIEVFWDEQTGIVSDSLSMKLDEGCTVRWKDNTVAPSWDSSKNLKAYQEKGMTPFDRKFMEGEQLRSEIEEQTVNRKKARIH